MNRVHPGADRTLVEVVVLKLAELDASAARELVGGGLISGVELLFVHERVAVVAVDLDRLGAFLTAVGNLGAVVVGRAKVPADLLSAAVEPALAGRLRKVSG